MIKKIPSASLRIGMFVDHIDREWLKNPFLKKQFKLVSDSQLKKFFDYQIEEVYIDTAKGLDVIQQTRSSNAGVKGSIPREEKGETDTGSPEEDLGRAKKVEKLYEKSYQATHELMNDVRLGKLVDAKEVSRTVENLVEQIFDDQEALVGLSKLQDYDDYTYTHSLNVCIFCLAIGKALGYSKERLAVLGEGALIHDFGKMLVPLEVLNKPGKLTDSEFKIMKEHVIRGVAYIREIPGIFPDAIRVAKEHHERFSGKGYPLGLKENSISEFGRIAAVVDVYDAITSDRVYHRGMIPTRALQKIYEWRYHDFDPVLVEMFIKIVGIYPLGSLVMLSDGCVGMVVEGNIHNSLRPRILLLFDKGGKPLTEPEILDLDLAQNFSLKILHNVEPETLELDLKKTWNKYL